MAGSEDQLTARATGAARVGPPGPQPQTTDHRPQSGLVVTGLWQHRIGSGRTGVPLSRPDLLAVEVLSTSLSA